MDAIFDGDVAGIIYRYKHELEYRATVELVERIGIILRNEMFDNHLPLKSFLKPVAYPWMGKDVYFRISELDHKHLKSSTDYSKAINVQNIRNFRYEADGSNFLSKFRIKYKKPQPTYLYDLLHLAQQLGVKKDPTRNILFKMSVLYHEEYKLTDVGFKEKGRYGN